MMNITKESRMNWNETVNPILPHELTGKKWDEMFSDEKELQEALVKMDIEAARRKRYAGYGYYVPFQRVLKEGKELSPKQLTQLKRIASVIFCYTWNAANTHYHR